MASDETLLDDSGKLLKFWFFEHIIDGIDWLIFSFFKIPLIYLWLIDYSFTYNLHTFIGKKRWTPFNFIDSKNLEQAFVNRNQTIIATDGGRFEVS